MKKLIKEKQLLVDELLRCNDYIDNAIEEINKGDQDIVFLINDLVDALRESANELLIILIKGFLQKPKSSISGKQITAKVSPTSKEDMDNISKLLNDK